MLGVAAITALISVDADVSTHLAVSYSGTQGTVANGLRVILARRGAHAFHRGA